MRLKNRNNKKWFTGDTHFWHTNIIHYCQRPFANIEEHNETIRKNWNNLVAPEDDIYHVGDFAFWKQEPSPMGLIDFIHTLNGHLHFVEGNHDRAMIQIRKQYYGHVRGKVTFMRDLPLIKIEGQEIILSHYAMRAWNKSHHGSWNLYGHSHGTLPDDPHALAFDVGVDCHDYKPVDFETVRAIMAKKLWKPIDHHRPREETGGRGYSREEYAKLERRAQYEAFKREFENEKVTSI